MRLPSTDCLAANPELLSMSTTTRLLQRLRTAFGAVLMQSKMPKLSENVETQAQAKKLSDLDTYTPGPFAAGSKQTGPCLLEQEMKIYDQ